MASLFTNPLQALMGESNKAQSGPLASAEEAKANANLDADDSAWVFVGDDIDGTRWNKVYPYQLIIVEKTASGYANTGKVFTLPIPPTDITISTPFAITTSGDARWHRRGAQRGSHPAHHLQWQHGRRASQGHHGHARARPTSSRGSSRAP
jgi:hypothetical protein